MAWDVPHAVGPFGWRIYHFGAGLRLGELCDGAAVPGVSAGRMPDPGEPRGVDGMRRPGDTESVTDSDFVEVIIEWGPGGHVPVVVDWLRERGLHPTPMRAGLLVTGDRQSFRRAFGMDLDPAAAAGGRALPIPPAIANAVASISLPRPRRIQSAGDPAPSW